MSSSSFAKHADARMRGRKEWYSHFEVRVAKVERAYNLTTSQEPHRDPEG